jgi:hypothetical protein
MTVLRRVSLGRWWQELEKNGTCSYSDRALLLFPEHADRSLLGRSLGA